MPAPILIPFGPFEPDNAIPNSGVVTVAEKVYPLPAGYRYMPAPSTNVLGVAQTTPIRGGVVIQTSSAGAQSIYFGASNLIKRADSSDFGATLTTIATSTTPTNPALWRFAKFGTKLIAAHAGVDALYEDWTAAAAGMSTLGGSPPRATGVFTVGDFVFLTGLNSNKRKLQWSAINNAEGWTVGTGLSDEQEFPDGGDILGISGDKSGYIIQQNAIRTFQFLPGDTTTIFEFSKAQDIPGCAGLNAWAIANQTVYYYSDEGFCSIGPSGFKRIGAFRVDEYFKAKSSNITYLRAVSDPYGPRIFFAYDITADGNSDGVLVYDWMLDRWSENSAPDIYFWFHHLDATGGGAPFVFDSSGNSKKLDGVATNANLKTCLLEIFQKTGERAIINSLRPVVYGTVNSASATGQETIDGSATTSTSSAEGGNGRFSVNVSGVYNTVSMLASPASAADITKFLFGMQVWAAPAGEA